MKSAYFSKVYLFDTFYYTVISDTEQDSRSLAWKSKGWEPRIQLQNKHWQELHFEIKEIYN